MTRDEICANCNYGNYGGYKSEEEVRANERARAVDKIVDSIIFPLLDECDRGLWEDIDYIELAGKWVEALNNNPYPKVKNHDEAIKKDISKWILNQLKEQGNEKD